ncbi:hypothetical protein GNE88_28365 (plasmid) [Trichormus variabilis PNB]|uniref:hypothetical protein n=1 Tax=Anabaena variabilis TaxID=264691 RepID=UPI0016279F0D|nr:hypothetical protein [Trichormus variabilis]MBC1314908.1 hypothetical protein [Trichormus variabilis PNB]
MPHPPLGEPPLWAVSPVLPEGYPPQETGEPEGVSRLEGSGVRPQDRSGSGSRRVETSDLRSVKPTA